MQSNHHDYDRLTIANSPRHKSDSRGDAFSVSQADSKWPFVFTLIGAALVAGGFWLGVILAVNAG